MNLPSILDVALAACKAFKTESGEFCHSWIPDADKARGVAPCHLKELAKRGYLTRVAGSRGGHRAYYRLNPDAPRLAVIRVPTAL
jgi:hypothetical protein